MRISLGALSVQQTFNIARQGGFDPATARRMVAIAQKESGLNPAAACINCLKRPDGTPIRESSVGLWQINTNDPNVWRLIQSATGISSPEQLKDPLINAKAAYALYGGNERNLAIAWGIDRTSGFNDKAKYESFLAKLPPVEVLEGSPGGTYTPSGGTPPTGGGGNDTTGVNESPLPVFLARPGDVTPIDGSLDDATMLALAAGALLLVYALS